MSAGRDVAVVATGTANLASVRAALLRAGARPRLTADPDVVRAAAGVVLPGVGTFGAAMRTLAARGLDRALRERVAAGRPLLCVCVGFQALFERSAESPGVAGLAVLPGAIEPFTPGPGVRVPQFGWNRVAAAPGGAVLAAAGHAYFANSYRLAAAPAGCAVAMAEHGGPFVAAVERGALVGCQFHPELSGAFGRGLLSRWLERLRPTEVVA